MVPVEPEWLLEAIGLTGFDPAGQHIGPQPAGDGRLEIRTTIPRPEGTVTKVTIVDSIAGWVLEQHLYDQQGARIASSITSKHFTDPVSGVTLPKKIEIQWPATQFSMTIDMGTVVINQLGGDPAQLFELPRTGGVQLVNMADPNFHPPGAPPQPVAVPTYPAQQPVVPTAARQPITIAPPSTVWQPSMR
jgi:hypothetical protein